MTSTTISEFRTNIKKYVDFVINGSSSVIINRGNDAVVLISLEEYNSIKETERIQSSASLSYDLAGCVRELHEGKSVKVNLEDL